MKKLLVLSMVAVSLLLFTACGDEDGEQTWRIAPVYGWTCGCTGYKVPCYLVDDGNGVWRALDISAFRNFNYEKGYLYTVNVRVQPVSEPQMDDAPNIVVNVKKSKRVAMATVPDGISEEMIFDYDPATNTIEPCE